MVLPSTEPATERILSHVEAALAGIDRNHATVGYWNTSRTIHRMRVGYPNVSNLDLVIWITGGNVSDDLDSQEHSLNTELLSLQIDGWLEDASSDVETKLVRLMMDIRTALMQIPDRGGLAIHTSIRGFRIFHAEAQNSPFSKVEVDVDIRYRTRVEDLTMVN